MRTRSCPLTSPATLILVASILAGGGCEKKPEVASVPPDVEVVEAGKRDVSIYGEWVGTLDGYINAQIRAKVQGYLLSKQYQEGSYVKKGQVLFQLDPRQYQAALDQAKGDLAEAQANLLRSQQNVARYRPLAAQGAVSKKELDDTIQQMRANEATIEAARAAVENAKLNLAWTTVRSPIDGIAGLDQAQVGDLIAPTTLMTTVSQLDPIKVYAPISEQEYLRFAKRNPSAAEGTAPANRPPLELILADGSVYPHTGKVAAINRQIEVETGSVQVEALFPNSENLLRPGGYAKIRAVIDRRKDATVVPQRAVQEVQGSYQVAVVGPDDTVEFRSVTVGPRTGIDWVIDKGIEPGDRVVVEGLQKIRAGAKVVAKPAAADSEPTTQDDAPAGK
jgi:membrane fusion protein (multidrug efflux system)